MCSTVQKYQNLDPRCTLYDFAELRVRLIHENLRYTHEHITVVIGYLAGIQCMNAKDKGTESLKVKINSRGKKSSILSWTVGLRHLG